MLKKIILPLVLLIFTQQQIYGMKEERVDRSQKEPDNKWESINCWVNCDMTKEAGKRYPKLWWLWAFIDNITFQYGSSKIWKHGEAYYGLSNGIGFFPSFLNFGWLKVGIGDVHINVINFILDYFKNFIKCKTIGRYLKEEFNDIILDLLPGPIILNLCTNIHIFLVEIRNCIKIEFVAPLTILFYYNFKKGLIGYRGDYYTSWYITYACNRHPLSWWYAFWSPRMEINILELIDYLNGK